MQAREAAGSRDTLELSVAWTLAVLLQSVAGLALASLVDLSLALFSVFFKLRKLMLKGMDRQPPTPSPARGRTDGGWVHVLVFIRDHSLVLLIWFTFQ